MLLEAKTTFHVGIQIVMLSHRHDGISELAQWLLYCLHVSVIFLSEIVFFQEI